MKVGPFQHRRRPIIVGVSVLLAGWLVTVLPVSAQQRPEQTEHRRGFEPAGDEVFSVIASFYDFDRTLPLDARTVEEWETDDGRFEKVVFATSTGERVPGELALPRAGERPYPAVLLLHGLGSSKVRWWREDRAPLPKGLLAAGVAVLAIDLELHGERGARNDYQSPVFLTLGNDLRVRSRNMLIQSTIDARRALDVLAAREEIDGDRLGVAGYSLGAMIALFLTALEEDLAAVVACAVPTTQQTPPVDPFHFAARASVPTLLQIGRQDWLSSPEDAERLHDLLPEGKRELRFYDAGHVLPTEFASDAASWLRARLQGTAP